jgi:hypothetical protein
VGQGHALGVRVVPIEIDEFGFASVASLFDLAVTQRDYETGARQAETDLMRHEYKRAVLQKRSGETLGKDVLGGMGVDGR